MRKDPSTEDPARSPEGSFPRGNGEPRCDGAKVGSLVLSLSGKDKGSVLMIVAPCPEDRRFVFVADGRKRRIGKPKRKNRKHLRLLSEIAPSKGERAGMEKDVPRLQAKELTDRAVRDAVRWAAAKRTGETDGKEDGKEGDLRNGSLETVEIRMEEGSFCRKTM